jgi:flagellar biosynthetic protein FliR
VPFPLDKFVLFTLLLCRVSGLVMSAPIFGNKDIPMQFRGFLCVAVALLLLPTHWHIAPVLPGSTLQYLLLAGSEVLVGLCLGVGIDVLLSGAKLAGQIIGMTSGESMAEMYDPQTDESFAVLSQFFSTMTLLVFVCIGGHRLVLGALMDTFQAIPPGRAGGVDASLIDTLQTLLGQSFSLGIRAAAPAMLALMLATLVLGLVSRTLPQLNVMALGFGLNSLVMYGVLMVSIGAAAMTFQYQLEPTLEALVASLRSS